jgi:hypothetical protein
VVCVRFPDSAEPYGLWRDYPSQTAMRKRPENMHDLIGTGDNFVLIPG